MSDSNISTDQAKQDKLFYVVANIVIVNAQNASCLLLKRSETEKVHGGKWAFPGGKLEHADVQDLLDKLGKSPIEGVENILGKLAEREGKEECGLTVSAENAAIIKNKVFVRPDGVPVFMVVLATTYKDGEVVLEADSFTDYAWANKSELSTYDCIDGIVDEAAAAIDLFC